MDPLSSHSPVTYCSPRRFVELKPASELAPETAADSVTLQGSPTLAQPGPHMLQEPPAQGMPVLTRQTSPAPNLLVQLECADCTTPEAFEQVMGQLSTFESGYTQTHMQRTSEYAHGLAQALEGTALALTPSESRALQSAARVYDAGKLAVDETVWNDSRGPRDMPADEWKTMWSKMCRHVDVSTEKSRQAGKAGDSQVEFCLGALNSKVAAGDDDVRSIVRHHHEKLDGSGYPDGLQGDQIPKGAQILGICDMYEALRSPRSFRPAKDHAAARSIIESDANKGKLNAEMVRVFFNKVV